MTTFSNSIKELNTLVESLNANQISASAKTSLLGTDNDKLKFICDNKELIFKIIDVAKIFTGPNGDKVLDTLEDVIKKLCA